MVAAVAVAVALAVAVAVAVVVAAAATAAAAAEEVIVLAVHHMAEAGEAEVVGAVVEKIILMQFPQLKEHQVEVEL